MPQKVVQLSVADNLCRLARDFKSGDPAMSSAIRKEFKRKSLNDVTRAVVYLMEVIGSRDEQFKVIQNENKDLRELLKLNNIELDGTDENGTTPSTEGSNGVAATGATEDTGTGGAGTTSGSTGGSDGIAQAN